MENLIELLKKIITNVLTALYQPFWFAVILTIFLLFFYLYTYKPIDTGKGIRAAFRAWWQEFQTSLFFRKLFLLTFFTVMILFQTLINRNMWINPLSDIMGGWWIWHTAADGTDGGCVTSGCCRAPGTGERSECGTGSFKCTGREKSWLCLQQCTCGIFKTDGLLWLSVCISLRQIWRTL